MDLEIQPIKCGSIDDFTEQHSLTMEIIERELPVGDSMRYYAKFKRCEVKIRGCLEGRFGNGSTPETAIQDYATQISTQDLVFNAYTGSRKEIKCWRLTSEQAKPQKPVCLTQFAPGRFASFKDMAEYYENASLTESPGLEDVLSDTKYLVKAIQDYFTKENK